MQDMNIHVDCVHAKNHGLEELTALLKETKVYWGEMVQKG